MEASWTLPKQGAIIAQEPCRADLAGGTIDLWPLYMFHPGALTLNFAVNILTTCRITPLKGKRIQLRSVDTRREETFSSFEELRRGRRHFRFLGAHDRDHCGPGPIHRPPPHARADASHRAEYRSADHQCAHRMPGLLSGALWGSQRHPPECGWNPPGERSGFARGDRIAFRAGVYRSAAAIGHQQLGGFPGAHQWRQAGVP